MSYDVEILTDDPNAEFECLEAVGSMTFNVGAMYYRVMSEGLRTLNQKRCSEAIPILQDAIVDMVRRYHELKELEPRNSWGSYNGAVIYLLRILEACKENPTGYVSVDT